MDSQHVASGTSKLIAGFPLLVLADYLGGPSGNLPMPPELHAKLLSGRPVLACGYSSMGRFLDSFSILFDPSFFSIPASSMCFLGFPEVC